MAVILVMALTFGVMYALDKGFTRLFRARDQHKSGTAVRLPKMYALIGMVLVILGILVFFVDGKGNILLILGGIVVGLMGGFLIAYYLGFGIFYDEESFLVSSLGKKSRSYRYTQIRGQMLYVVQGGSMIVELHMDDGTAVSVQSKMAGSLAFLDKAFFGWCRQKGMDPDGCEFHNPDQWQWFPMEE